MNKRFDTLLTLIPQNDTYLERQSQQIQRIKQKY